MNNLKPETLLLYGIGGLILYKMSKVALLAAGGYVLYTMYQKGELVGISNPIWNQPLGRGRRSYGLGQVPRPRSERMFRHMEKYGVEVLPPIGAGLRRGYGFPGATGMTGFTSGGCCGG